jgi:hypothetical protein
MSEQSKPGAQPGPSQPEPARPGVRAGSVVASIVAAAFGVQSSRARERDFAQGNYRHFIVGGIVFTVLFVLTLVLVVRMVLAEP